MRLAFARQSACTCCSLAEAVFLSVTGGVAGITLGVALSWSITIVAGWRAPVSAFAIGGGFLFSATVGIFGFVLDTVAAHRLRSPSLALANPLSACDEVGQYA